MAIRIIYGPGGSGKSRFQVELIVKQLRETPRNVCTNLALNVPRLQQYLDETYPDGPSIDVGGRVRLLTDSETREFWLYRGPVRWAPGTEYDMVTDPGLLGTCFVIDEAGAAGFDAQAWAESDGRSTRGVRCKWYLDQQRKFSDDVFASTNGRSPAGIAKGFRDKAHGFIRLKNNRLAVFGPFRGRDNFKWEEFVSEPSPSARIEPIASGTFKLDEKGLASCYRTEQGVGVLGNKADKGARAKGIPILWIFPIVISVGLLCAAVPWGIGKLVARGLTGEKSKARQQVEAARSALVPPAVESGALSLPQSNSPRSERSDLNQAEKRTRADLSIGDVLAHPSTVPAGVVYVSGVATRGNHVSVTLSDGRVLNEADGVVSVTQTAVMMRDGRAFPFARMVPGASLLRRSGGIVSLPSKKSVPEPEAKTSPSLPTPQMKRAGGG